MILLVRGSLEVVMMVFKYLYLRTFFYVISINEIGQTMNLVFSIRIPENDQPSAALVTDFGPDASYVTAIFITKQDPLTVLEIQVTKNSWKHRRSAPIQPNGDKPQGNPSWKLMIPLEVDPVDVVFIFAIDYLFSFEYCNFQPVCGVNVTNCYQHPYEIDDVTGAGSSELQRRVYVARSGSSAGEINMYKFSLSGNLKCGEVVYIEDSPENFLTETGSEDSHLLWSETDSEGSIGYLYKYTLGDISSLLSTNATFQSGEIWGKARVVSFDGTLACYVSGVPNEGGYTLRKVSMDPF